MAAGAETIPRPPPGVGCGDLLATMDEPYTAARLAVDFLTTIDHQEGGELRSATRQSLERMGAVASLAHLAGA